MTTVTDTETLEAQEGHVQCLEAGASGYHDPIPVHEYEWDYEGWCAAAQQHRAKSMAALEADASQDRWPAIRQMAQAALARMALGKTPWPAYPCPIGGPPWDGPDDWARTEAQAALTRLDV